MNPAAKQALDLAKKNIPSIACCVAGLAAVGAYFFYPVPQMYATFNQETAAAASKYSEIDSLAKFNANQPAIFTAAGGEPQPLGVFPTNDVITAYDSARTRFIDESKRLVDAVLKSNSQMPLEAGMLPMPTRGQEVTTFRAFQEAYVRRYGLDPRMREQSFVTTILKGAQPPTPNDIAELSRRVAAEVRRNQTERDSTGRVTNQQEVDRAIQEESAKILPRERTLRATNSKVMVSPDAFRPLSAYLQLIGQNSAGGNPGGNTGTVGAGTVNVATDIIPVFNAQVGLWIHESLARSIAQSNAAATSVFDAPIKHVVSVSWSEQLVTAAPQAQPGFGMPAAPVDPSAAPPTLPPVDLTAAVTPSYMQSPWGHGNNNSYFAVPVRMTLRVDAKRLSQVLLSLSKDNFLFIDNVNFRMVDINQAKQQGFIYGSDNVVEVELQCTLLMLKNWMIPMMPPPIVQALAAAAAPPAQ
jgi:hypothetical protein